MLHTVNKSPNEKLSLMSCLRLATPGSDILLIEDGVYASLSGAAMAPMMHEAVEKFSVYVLEPDLTVRGLQSSAIVDGISKIDYAGFVSLAVQNQSIQSWL